MRRWLILLALFCFTFPVAAQDASTTAERLEALGGQPCESNADFTCVSITVPLDHFDPANSETIEVVFGVLPASDPDQRIGTFVTVVGGPGYSGLEATNSYLGAWDAALFERFDNVFFDLRGVGASGSVECPDAVSVYNRSQADPFTPEDQLALIDAARAFAQDCIAEIGDAASLLPYMTTAQAVEDLEAFRQAMGDETIWLYGESYGTQFAQTYASAHPDALAALILDGVVDLTRDGVTYYVEQAAAFGEVLRLSFEACAADEACVADFADADPAAAYQAVLDTLPVTVDFPLSNGTSEPREFTRADLEFVAGDATYAEWLRAAFLRQLAAAHRGDYLPLVRQLYVDLNINPQTLEVEPDPLFSEAAYYAFDCGDYRFFEGTADERAAAWIAEGQRLQGEIPYLVSVFYGDLPCVFWTEALGVSGEDVRPEPFTLQGVPVILLNASADNATPISNADAVYATLESSGADVYSITLTGGRHVIWGWGEECPDVQITAFLLEGTLPDERQSTCEGSILGDYYTPLSPLTFYGDVEASLSALDTELNLLPEYVNWDGTGMEMVGCAYGGMVMFHEQSTGEMWMLDECAMTPDFAVSGNADVDYDAGTFILEAEYSDGEATYTRAADGSISVESGE